MSRPFVSVCIISYNHARYFEQAIESVLSQKYNFDLEIIICDDHSTDGTAELIEQYASVYPNLIKAYYSDKNTGMHANWARALKLCNGKYIALLESDDYWCDPLKLQKQVDVLEKNMNAVACFTEAKIIYENKPDGYPWYVEGKKINYTVKDIIFNNFIPTCTVLMRNFITDGFFPPTYYKSPFADWILHFQNLQHGSYSYLNEVTSCYRVHGQGVWGGIDEKKQLLNRLTVTYCLEEINKRPELVETIHEARKIWLQKICHFYKTNGEYISYLKFRFRLYFN